MGITTDPNDPRLTHGNDSTPVKQAEVYLVMSDADVAKGYVKPYRDTYRHATCGSTTRMPVKTAETYAANPWFYGGTYCVQCGMHRELEEFSWLDGEPMSPRKWPVEEHERIAKLRAPAP